MYIFIVLLITGVKASATATLSFIFPDFEKEEIREEKVEKPLIRLLGVKEENGKFVIGLSSENSGEVKINVVVAYENRIFRGVSGISISGSQKIKIPIVLSGSGERVRWVKISWESDSLVVWNASCDMNEDLSNFLLSQN
ncbi:MAG: hypothetical protein ABIN61_03715 [candidate division WOR-3 bacterium]